MEVFILKKYPCERNKCFLFWGFLFIFNFFAGGGGVIAVWTARVCTTIHVQTKDYEAMKSPNFCNLHTTTHWAASNAKWLVFFFIQCLLNNDGYINLLQSKLILHWWHHSNRNPLYLKERRKQISILRLFSD